MVDCHPVKTSKIETNEPILRIAIRLRLGSNFCNRHRFVCGKNVTEDDWHGFAFCTIILNAYLKQNLSSTHILLFYSQDTSTGPSEAIRQFDGLKIVPWAVGRQFLWSVTLPRP